MPRPSAPVRVSRRVLLASGGVAAAGVVGAGAWAGRDRLLGPSGPNGPVPDVEPGRLVSGSFVSPERLGAQVGWSIAYPPGVAPGARLPVAVVLHGKHGNHAKVFDPDYLALDRFLAAEVAASGTAYALASVDGGNTYWHARATGEDAGAMVRDELLPLLARHGLRTGRVGLLGWSMGGFGVLSLAGQWGRSRVAAVCAESPALFPSYDVAAPGAYDDAVDLAAVTVFGRQSSLAGIPLRIDCGTSDPFYDYTRTYLRGFAPRTARPVASFTPGAHEVGYWRSRAPAQLRFLSRAFA